MPSSPNRKRNYKKEAKYDSKPSVKKKRAARNRARYALMKKGKVRLGDGMDVDHKNGNANDNSPSNLRVVKREINRSYPRTSSARKRNKND